MRIDSLTDIGVKRVENQDNYWSARLSYRGVESGIICICDGMGGLDDGGYASRSVVSEVKEYFSSTLDFEGVSEKVKAINSQIFLRAKSEGKRMGTTCTLLQCAQGVYKLFHVGDSRCYLVSDGKLKKLTKDHSALEKYGIKKSENPELYNKYKSSLTRCIGVKEEVELDYYEGTYSSSDAFLCCSDGFWHYIEDCGLSVSDLSSLNTIVKNCISNGETDNITVSVLYILGG